MLIWNFITKLHCLPSSKGRVSFLWFWESSDFSFLFTAPLRNGANDTISSNKAENIDMYEVVEYKTDYMMHFVSKT